MSYIEYYTNDVLGYRINLEKDGVYWLDYDNNEDLIKEILKRAN